MRLIGIHGKARSGKDEFCQILCKLYGFKRIAFADYLRNLGIEYFGLSKEEVTDKKTKNSRQILQGIGLSARNNLKHIHNWMEEDSPTMGVSDYPLWVEKLAISEFAIETADLKRKLKYLRTVLDGLSNMWYDKIDEFDYIVQHSPTRDPKDIWINILLSQIQDKDQVYIIPDTRFKNEYNMLHALNCGRTVKIFRVDNPDIEAGANHQSEIDLDNIIDWDFKVVNEHKADWRERLVLASSNMVRKFRDQGFFTSEDMDKFKINLDEH